MKFKTKLIYLGFKTANSKKSGNAYLLVSFMDENSSIYEFYVPSDRLQLVTDVGQLPKFAEVNVVLALSSFNNKPQIDLEGVAK
jgi:hypothetical protein